MDSRTFNSVWLAAMTRVEKAIAAHEQEFYAPEVTALGRMLWENMQPQQRAMTLSKRPDMAEGIQQMLGGNNAR